MSPEGAGGAPPDGGDPLTIVRLGPDDADRVAALGHLFDDPARADATGRFLAQDNHHLLVAERRGRPVGFVSGVETVHPDKGAEMLLYELAVDEGARRRGVGSALVRALAELATARRCYSLWVLVDADNDPALATYRSAGLADEGSPVMLGRRLAPSD